MLKEENSKLKHDMIQKEILIKSLAKALHLERAKQMRQTESRQMRKHQLDKMYH